MRTLAFRHGHPVSRGRDGCWLRVEGEREGPLRCHHRPCCHCSVPPYPSFDNTDTNKGQVDGRPGGFNCTGVPDCETRDFKNRFKNRDRIVTFKGNIINGLMD